MNMHLMHVMDHTGHTEIRWNPDNPDEVKVAEEMFKEMKAKGHSIFRVYGGDKPGQRLEKFDKHAEKLLVIPQLVGG